MSMVILAVLLQVLWSLPESSICASVDVSEECKAFCESKRPQDNPQKPFTIYCFEFKSSEDMSVCQAMCESNKCPQAACKARDSDLLLKCPAKNETEINDSHRREEEGWGWEDVLLYGGFLASLILCGVLVSLCICDHFHFQRGHRGRLDEEGEHQIHCCPARVRSPIHHHP